MVKTTTVSACGLYTLQQETRLYQKLEIIPKPTIIQSVDCFLVRKMVAGSWSEKTNNPASLMVLPRYNILD